MIDEFVPDVEIEAHCPVCDELLAHDYYWHCTSCLLIWEPDGTEGKLLESEDEFDDLLDSL